MHQAWILGICKFVKSIRNTEKILKFRDNKISNDEFNILSW